LEPNTLFHRNPPQLPDEDASSDMQQQIEAVLATHGYQHYETSAFAQPQHRSRHNLNTGSSAIISVLVPVLTAS